jgi:hypothetical protein
LNLPTSPAESDFSLPLFGAGEHDDLPYSMEIGQGQPCTVLGASTWRMDFLFYSLIYHQPNKVPIMFSFFFPVFPFHSSFSCHLTPQ